jgi:hypothetical protein
MQVGIDACMHACVRYVTLCYVMRSCRGHGRHQLFFKLTSDNVVVIALFGPGSEDLPRDGELVFCLIV